MRVKGLGTVLACFLYASTAYSVDSETLLNLQDPDPTTFGGLSSDQLQGVRIEGKIDDTANPTYKVPVLPCVASSSAPAYTDGNIVPCSVELDGDLRVTGAGAGTTIRETFTAFTAAVDPTASTDYLTVFNGVGSGRVVRVTQIDVRTDLDGNVTGLTIPATYSRTTTSGTTCTSVTINPYDSTNAAVPGTIVANSDCTTDPTVDFEMGQCTYRSEENPNGGEAGICFTYDNTRETQPITLREGEGLMLRQNAISPNANNDRIRIRFELTIAGS